jgi:hypothetical protein
MSFELFCIAIFDQTQLDLRHKKLKTLIWISRIPVHSLSVRNARSGFLRLWSGLGLTWA